MPTLTITTRTTKNGPRYVVRFRLGGRAWPIVHGGSFRTLKEASSAATSSPVRSPPDGTRPTRSALLSPKPKRPRASYFEAWKASRLDLDSRTLDNCDFHWKRLEPAFGSLAPEEITFHDVQAWISANSAGDKSLSPKVLRDYMGTLKQVLDFAGVDPNPARDRRIRYPTAEPRSPSRPRTSTCSRCSRRSRPSGGSCSCS